MAVKVAGSPKHVKPELQAAALMLEAINRDLRTADMPTSCGVPSPSPRPSPAGRGRIDGRLLVNPVRPTIPQHGCGSSLSQRSRGEGEAIVLWLGFEHCRFKVPMHARKRKAVFHEWPAFPNRLATRAICANTILGLKNSQNVQTPEPAKAGTPRAVCFYSPDFFVCGAFFCAVGKSFLARVRNSSAWRVQAWSSSFTLSGNSAARFLVSLRSASRS